MTWQPGGDFQVSLGIEGKEKIDTVKVVAADATGLGKRQYFCEQEIVLVVQVWEKRSAEGIVAWMGM